MGEVRYGTSEASIAKVKVLKRRTVEYIMWEPAM